MSRIGRSPIRIPDGVKVNISDGSVRVEGPKGKLETPVPNGIQVKLEDGTLVASRSDDAPQSRALHGLTRALLANSVRGVSEGFEKQLDVVGIGYRAEVRGKSLNLSLGHSHPIEFPIPEGIEVKVEREQKAIPNYVATIKIAGPDRQQVGQVAADVRRLRSPDPYKGKGVRYAGEVVRLKVGKKGA
ncbi:MAG TPA: 50S ribosomal protein L6 [Acidobacteriota bacterium]|nr:50S ribosomal protein L6 [Acidobacteriota bacterium]